MLSVKKVNEKACNVLMVLLKFLETLIVRKFERGLNLKIPDLLPKIPEKNEPLSSLLSDRGQIRSTETEKNVVFLHICKTEECQLQSLLPMINE